MLATKAFFSKKKLREEYRYIKSTVYPQHVVYLTGS